MKQIITSQRKLKEISYYRNAKANTLSFFLKLCFALLVAFTAITESQAQQFQGKYFNNLNNDGVIIDGYDAIAFFTDNKPVKGDAKFQYSYEDAIYYFASQEHLDLFKANPEKYKVQFGGWCAYAVSLGRIAPIDVNTFSIVNDRLVIQHNQRAVDGWNKDVKGNLTLANRYWPSVSSKGGKQITTDEEKGSPNVGKKLLINGLPALNGLPSVLPVANFPLKLSIVCYEVKQLIFG